jgi:uncharacterized protein (TIGR03790 family)
MRCAGVGGPVVSMAAITLLLLAPAPAHAQTGHNVLLVVNAKSADSIRIGEHYARARSVPEAQVLRLTELADDPADGIDRAAFDRAINAPIARWLARNQAQDRILFIVLTKGIPLRINGSSQTNSAASVDSELTMLYQRMAGVQIPLAGPLPNPFFQGARPMAEARPFTHEAYPLYLVTRLDGFTVADVLGLIDRGMSPSRTGRFVLDGKASWTDKGNVWLREAADRLRAAGLPPDRVIHDESAAVLADQQAVLGYYSWGSNDPAIRRRRFGFSFQPGAIGGMFVSTDGRTFREPPDDWAVADWTDKKTFFAGSPQSLAGDLIREGLTGVAGHVAEPLLGNTVRPDILFPAYFSGFSLAEAFYLAMPSVSWMTVVVGDPLCSPFTEASNTRLADSPIDPATELPVSFSERRLATLEGPRVPRQALQFFVRSESRAARGDGAGSRSDLEHAVRLAPTWLTPQYTLASSYEVEKQFDQAIAQYRQILKADSRQALALNNLAYSLAVQKGELSEALPLAERAWTLAPRSGAAADTLGLIYLMRGDVGRGRPLLRQAATLAPDNAEIRLHLAQAHLAAGDRAACDKELAAALALAPALRTRPEVVLLLEKQP